MEQRRVWLCCSTGSLQKIQHVLCDGAFDYEDIGAKVPYEMHRDPKTHGGERYSVYETEKVFAPYGFRLLENLWLQNPQQMQNLLMDLTGHWLITEKQIPIKSDRSQSNSIARIIQRVGGDRYGGICRQGFFMKIHFMARSYRRKLPSMILKASIFVKFLTFQESMI